MSQNPISNLGLSCPSGGDFYICQDSDTRFLGCCGVNPCDGSSKGNCAPASLFSAAFNAAKYNDIPEQACTSSSSAQWYTCTDGPTFMGCCSSNPCNNGGICPDDDLTEAVLNDNAKSASVFVTTASSTLIAPTGATTATPASSNGSSNSNHLSVPIGAIGGGILGGLVILALAVFAFLRYRRRRMKTSTLSPHPDDDQIISTRLWSPYADSNQSSPALKSPNSPAFPSSTSKSPRQSLFSSLLGGSKRPSATRSFLLSTSDYEPVSGFSGGGGRPSSGFQTPIIELDAASLPHTSLVRDHQHYYEVMGSIPESEPRPLRELDGGGRI
ncbi:hypothetical protein F5Y16DRAFT_374097 [Xylariaceae sp. FL0255]|nr:hypothetical protein F5Y16DRAFT_374097 [Xylariaceae sp. FL0255]